MSHKIIHIHKNRFHANDHHTVMIILPILVFFVIALFLLSRLPKSQVAWQHTNPTVLGVENKIEK